jgi:hypothetical protein
LENRKCGFLIHLELHFHIKLVRETHLTNKKQGKGEKQILIDPRDGGEDIVEGKVETRRWLIATQAVFQRKRGSVSVLCGLL